MVTRFCRIHLHVSCAICADFSFIVLLWHEIKSFARADKADKDFPGIDSKAVRLAKLDWKPAAVIFPRFGSFRGKFSKPWKNPAEKFQALEKPRALFPSPGKKRANFFQALETIPRVAAVFFWVGWRVGWPRSDERGYAGDFIKTRVGNLRPYAFGAMMLCASVASLVRVRPTSTATTAAASGQTNRCTQLRFSGALENYSR